MPSNEGMRDENIGRAISESVWTRKQSPSRTEEQTSASSALQRTCCFQARRVVAQLVSRLRKACQAMPMKTTKQRAHSEAEGEVVAWKWYRWSHFPVRTSTTPC